MSERVNLLATLDAGYLPQLEIMLHSLLCANPDMRVALYVLHSSLTSAQLEGVERLLAGHGGALHAVKAPADFLADAPVTDRYPREMYYRIFAAHYLPQEVERVLYLDPDIVVNGSIAELWETPLGDCLFAAATHVREALRRLNALRLGIAERVPYINSGVMLMNLARLREEQDAEAVFRYIAEHRKALLLPDQDVISGMYGARILPLDPYRYNMTERLFVMRPDAEAWRDLAWVREHSAIIHYCGRNKPWRDNYLGKLDVFYHEAAERYRKEGEAGAR